MSMEKEQIEEYIKQLMDLEKNIKDFQTEDTDTVEGDEIVEDLDSLLSSLSNDIQTSYGVNSLILPVKIKKLDENAIIPKYSKDGDAGLDLTITSIINETNFDVTYGFGIAMEIPKGYVGLIFPRSSIRKYELLLSNSVGVIDSGYRGEIQSTFKKTNGITSVKYNIGDRGAQILILPYPKIEFVETDNLTETERNDGGFGSTGN